MTAQRSLFDAVEGERRKRRGQERASARFSGFVEQCRAEAVRICRERGEVNADDLWAAGLTPPKGASHNVLGTVFQDRRFEFVRYTKSQRPEAHSNLIRVWRLRRG